jgi:hypothetical protein
MALPESEYPGKGKLPLAAAGASPGGVANRPLPAGASNRPIPLKPRSGSELPEDDDDELEDDEDTDLKEALRNAPAWLVSTVFHMLMLIVLGLFVYSTRDQSANLQVEVSYTDPGEQLDDPSVLDAASTQIETAPEQLITPLDLKPVDDPLAAPLEMADLNLPLRPTIPDASSNLEGAPIGLALKGREAGSRRVLLKKYGGTGATEDAVELGLKWLVRQQKADGTWSLSGPYDYGAPSENVPAATAMALLAFQGHGDTHRDGTYSKVVDRAWSAMLKMQQKDGLITGSMASANQLLYTHAQCTIALCELYGMTKDSRFRGPAERAIAYAIVAQDRQGGGWRYEPRKESDTSVTGWYVMALQSARMAGLKVPEDVFKRIGGFLDSVAIDDGRRYAYQVLTKQPTSALAAEGLLCRQYLGWPQNDPRLVEGITELVQKWPIKYDQGVNHDVYYWYYATQVAHHMGGKIWDEWNHNMRVVVPDKQIKTGPETGSWDPLADRWGDFEGRLYVTCLSIYMLEVYYRHLPIYSGYKFVAGVGQTMDPDAKPNDPKANPVAESPEGKAQEPEAKDPAAAKDEAPKVEPD